MSITFDKEFQIFYLDGKDTTYAFFINEAGYPCHLHYGARVAHDDLRYAWTAKGRASCLATPSGVNVGKHCFVRYSPEITFFGTGDYREPTVQVQNIEGDRLCDLRYDSHEILAKKPAISGMPSLRGGETLVLHLKDGVTGFGADLYYTVYDDAAVIARRIVYRNNGKNPCKLLRAYSFAMGMPGQNYDIMRLQGSWAAERQVEWSNLCHGVTSIDSKRTSSSATLNPFLGIVEKGCTETHGQAYGFNLIYSSSFVLKAEGYESGDTVITGGINDLDFSWKLVPGEHFETPEVVIAYSREGLGGMSRAFHDAFRTYLIPQRFVYTPRPIVINNWEATYFDFDTDKLKAIVDAVAGTGIDTFVLDDGWFGARSNDKAGLGDWVVNTEKLQGGLGAIIDHVHSKGMKFGLWFEPEMVNEDSDLFRAHPDYAIGVPNRGRCYSRTQFMLDLTRADVRDYIVESVNKVLHENEIDYVKWDYNRNVTESYSFGRDAEQQTEFAHRYVLGFYDLCERIVAANPNVFFEGCSSGGARFDGGVLAYFPQIWTSDDSDAEERTRIQYGTSMVYPLSTMSCHVSEVPNHQVGRITPLKTRSNIAHLGATGYELDTSRYTDEDRQVVCEQVVEYKQYEDLILGGDLYRIDSPFEGNYFSEIVVAKDKSEAMLTVYRRLAAPNPEAYRITLQGLDPNKTYHMTGDRMDITAKGMTLCHLGIPIPLRSAGDFLCEVYHLIEVN